MNTQAVSAPFTYLHPDFTQELIVSTNAPGSGGSVAGVTLGLDGYIYTNDNGGGVVQKWDPNNRVSVGGAMVSSHVASLSSAAYNGWGITTDSSGAIFHTTKTGATTAIVGSTGTFIDQVAIDPTGPFIAGADLSYGNVKLWDATTGALINTAAVGSGHRPDGIAFDSLGNIYTNNTDGTVTRIEFGSGYSAGPTGHTLIASGGFYGDLAGVGVDGSFYLSQYGTRFDNGAINGNTSIVKLSFNSSSGGTFVDGGRSSVPEPGIFGLMALPLLAFGFTARQRQKKA